MLDSTGNVLLLVVGVLGVLGLIVALLYRGLTRLQQRLDMDQQAAQQPAALRDIYQQLHAVQAAAQATAGTAQEQAAAAQAAVGAMFVQVQALQTVVSDLRADLDDQRAYTRAAVQAFKLAIAPEPTEVRERIEGRLRLPEPPKGRRPTGPLVPPLIAPGTPLSAADQRALVDLLVAAPGLQDRLARDTLLYNLPPDFQGLCTRSNTPRDDLTSMVYRAATWGSAPGQPPALVTFLDQAATVLGDSSQAGRALRNYRARLGLLPAPLEPPAYSPANTAG